MLTRNRNSKDALDKIKYHKQQAEDLRKQIKNLQGELAQHNRLAKELDEANNKRIKKHRFKVDVARITKNQDLIVNSLRIVGHRTTAGPICDALKNFGIKCHCSEFAAKFLPAVLLDSRVVITKINARKNEYSLKEWDKL